MRCARASAARRMRTGTRWTIFVKLPVAFSGGSSANARPCRGEAVDHAGQRAVRQRVVQFDGLADAHVADLRFLEVRDEVDRVDGHDGQQARAGLHVLTDAHGAIADAAGEGAAHDRVVEVELRLCGAGLRASSCARACWSCAIVRRDLRAGGGDRRIVRGERRGRLIARALQVGHAFVRFRAGRGERRIARVFVAGVLRIDTRHLRLCIGLFEIRMLLADVGLGACDVGAARVDR